MNDNRPEFEDSLVAFRMAGEDRGVPLRQVGITKLRYPIKIWDRAQQLQRTVGTFKLTVDLPKEFRSTHRSRLIAALERYAGEFSLETMPDLVDDIRNRLDAERAHVRVDFTYFIRRKAPVSEVESSMDLPCWFVGDAGERDAAFTLGVEVPVMTRVAYAGETNTGLRHCQRSRIRMSVRFRELVWLEELVEVAERAATSPVYPLLSLEDEKAVVESAKMEHAVNAEDLVRAVAAALVKDERITWFYVEADNDAPLRNHNAYAAVGSDDL